MNPVREAKVPSQPPAKSPTPRLYQKSRGFAATKVSGSSQDDELDAMALINSANESNLKQQKALRETKAQTIASAFARAPQVNQNALKEPVSFALGGFQAEGAYLGVEAKGSSGIPAQGVSVSFCPTFEVRKQDMTNREMKG